MDSYNNLKLKRIEIYNVQSVKRLALDFDETGVYHIAGKHNIGKSVIIKAINILFNNISNFRYKHYIRDNETSFMIIASFWDGGEVTLSRGEVDYYEWAIPGKDGEVIKGNSGRTNGQVPDVLKDYFGLYTDEEKTKECLNIRTPRSRLLFVDTTGGDNYYLIQQALKTEEMLLATRLANKDRNNVRKMKDYVEERNVEEEERLELVKQEYEEIKKKHDEQERVMDLLNKEMSTYEGLESLVDTTYQLYTIEQELEDLGKVNEADMETIRETLDELVKLDKLLELHKTLEAQEKEVLKLTEQAKAGEELAEEVTELKKLNQLVELTKEVTLKEKELEKSEKIVDGMNTLEQFVNELKNLERVTRLEKELQEKQELHDRLDFTSYEELTKEMQSYTLITDLVKELSELKKIVTDKKQVEQDLVDGEEELSEYMVANNFCPIVAQRSDKKCPFGAVDLSS